MEGWIKLHRQIIDHWIYKDPVKFRWWIDILLTVNHERSKVNIGFELFDCNRGQSVMSLLSWANRWNVNKDTARNFLKLLEKDNMIILENLSKTTRLTVCKYEDYQVNLHDKQTINKRKTNAEQTQSDPNKNEKNEKNEKKKDIYGSNKNISLSKDEYEKLKIEYGLLSNEAIEYLSNYKIEKSYKTNSDYLTIKRWVIKAIKDKKNNNSLIQIPK